MGRKYFCDNCGDEVPKDRLYQVDAYPLDGEDDDTIDFGELCDRCVKALKKIRDDGFQAAVPT